MKRILIFIIILLIVFFYFYKKTKLKKDLIFFLTKINLLLQTSDFYHAIFHECKKIQHLLVFKFWLIPNSRLKNLLRHLEDIKNILISPDTFQRKAININYMLLLTYDQIITVLKQKYGFVQGDYFLDRQYTVNLSIKRSQEGLEIHHIKENEMRGLSNPEHAKKAPFEYQKSYNLVYCNLLEHFILHCKIWDHSKNPLQANVGQKGAEILLKRLNDVFNNNKFHHLAYQRKAAQKIYYQKKEFWKCYRFFKSLEIYL